MEWAATKNGDTYDGRQLIRLLKVELRPVSEQVAGFFAQHTDRFVIDDDDMNSDTATNQTFR